MERRELFRLTGAAAVPALAGLTPERLLALGRDAHRRAAEAASRLAFDAHQSATVAAVAERIIPATDTPGAREAGVAEFIDLIVAEWFSDEDRERFLRGLAGLDGRTRAAVGRSFVAATPIEQDAILAGLESEARALRDAEPSAPRHFFEAMKRLTLHGYYTSEIGMRQELFWHVIPGRYDGCVDLAAIPAPGREGGGP